MKGIPATAVGRTQARWPTPATWETTLATSVILRADWDQGCRVQNDIASLDPRSVRERFLISGEVNSQNFPHWIDRYTQRLGLRGGVSAVRQGEVEVIASGPLDLLDALELGCSLGPIDVLVDHVRRESSPV